ncbi:ferredoxin-NADP reductase [Kitasatospora sp. SolWspMP-SS2h]|uniref:FAD-binding oxidoreductase n=1 Tax=Kitasatospora sp. SolWspMP-SS2h TaxID=1305729 RepID=UPI000DB92786|nr:FAD-binding oxidoreductase [Kitasatospora sp. SolWspMP-SS2h]RAJ31290.1 ferredoxin-NADP reductase [Kitasatospora sp. SolWspMP-SS2h]
MTHWRRAELRARTSESTTARTLHLTVDGWPGHLPGQHVDVRLTADDGYRAVRSYSLSAPADGDRIEMSIQPAPFGEVSPYLAEDFPVGAGIEVAGPLGGWFVWKPGRTGPVLLVAGGSGIAPLAAMLRARLDLGEAGPRFHLAYSLRDPDQRWFGTLLDGIAEARDPGVTAACLYTRTAPPGHTRPVGRITATDLDLPGFRPADEALAFVCGPTAFVEKAAGLLVHLGHRPDRVRTERFG